MKDLETEKFRLYQVVNKFECEKVDKVHSFLFDKPLTWTEFLQWCRTRNAEMQLVVSYISFSKDLFINDPLM